MGRAAPARVLLPYRSQKTLGACILVFFLLPLPRLLLMRGENGADWYRNYSLFQALQESLFKELPLSSAACLSLTRCSLRWQTRLKITCGSSLVQFHVTCLPSPRIDGDKILGGVDLESKAFVLPRLLKARENSFPVPVPGCVLTRWVGRRVRALAER